MDKIRQIKELLSKDRASGCKCEHCEQQITEMVQGGDKYDCDVCGYTGPPVTMECSCYEGVCRPTARGSGCPHGAPACPTCDQGENDPWELLNAIRKIVEGDE